MAEVDGHEHFFDIIIQTALSEITEQDSRFPHVEQTRQTLHKYFRETQNTDFKERAVKTLERLQDHLERARWDVGVMNNPVLLERALVMKELTDLVLQKCRDLKREDTEAPREGSIGKTGDGRTSREILRPAELDGSKK